MNAKFVLNLTLALAVVLAGLFFPFGYINLGSASEAWYAPWPLTLLIGVTGVAVSVVQRKSARHAATTIIGLMALGHFLGSAQWLERLKDNELWIGKGVGWYTLAAVALYGLVLAPIVRSVRTFWVWAKT